MANRVFPPTLTPTTRVRVGWSPKFVFEYSGRWGCDVINWTVGVERHLWDLEVRACDVRLVVLCRRGCPFVSSRHNPLSLTMSSS